MTDGTCAVCEKADVGELVPVCEHVCESPSITYVRTGDGGAICTGCEAEGLAADRGMCAGCLDEMKVWCIEVSAEDRARGYSLATRRHFLVRSGILWPHVPAVAVGDAAKLSFSRVPSSGEYYLESMWIDVTERDGDRVIGTIDNEPQVIEQLSLGDRVEAHIDCFTEVQRPLSRRKDGHRCPTCDPDRRRRAGSDRDLLESIVEFGWNVDMVFPGEDDEDDLVWAYSTGLQHSYGHPEIAVFGVYDKSLGRLVNRVGAMVRDRLRIPTNVPVEGILEGHPCVFRPIASAYHDEYFGRAQWFYGRDPFTVLQLYWPDAAGRFPWHADFDPELVPLQPRLEDE